MFFVYRLLLAFIVPSSFLDDYLSIAFPRTCAAQFVQSLSSMKASAKPILSRIAWIASGTSAVSLLAEDWRRLTPSDSASTDAKTLQLPDTSSERRSLHFPGKQALSSLTVNRTLCEEDYANQPRARRRAAKKEDPTAEDDLGSYPNFSRHGSESLLRKYLTPELYADLKDKKTSMGVTLEDTLRAGISLPWGANPPRGIAGVFAGDAESYQVFRPLFDPLIVERHHAEISQPRRNTQRDLSRGPSTGSKMTLQRHRTNLNPQFLVQQRLDPDGEYVLFTRMRLARSLEGFRFAPCISRAERRTIEAILRDCCQDWKDGEYRPLMEMTNEMHDDLIQRRIMFPDPDEFALIAGTHRDWPDARGVYCNTWEGLPSITLWVNFEDHMSVGKWSQKFSSPVMVATSIGSSRISLFQFVRQKAATSSMFFGTYHGLYGL